MLVAMAKLTRRFHLPSALRRSPSRISGQTARELVAGGALLIDVRRQDDDVDRLEDALRISPEMIPSRVAGFPRDVPIVLGCT
jgi:rhodanese-related sulfurtransferase